MALQIQALSPAEVLTLSEKGGLVEVQDLNMWQAAAHSERMALAAMEDGEFVGLLLAHTCEKGTLCSTLSVKDTASHHAVPYSLLLALAEMLPEASTSPCHFSLHRADLVTRQAVEMFGAHPVPPGAGDDPDAWHAAVPNERLMRCRTPVSSMLG